MQSKELLKAIQWMEYVAPALNADDMLSSDDLRSQS